MSGEEDMKLKKLSEQIQTLKQAIQYNIESPLVRRRRRRFRDASI